MGQTSIWRLVPRSVLRDLIPLFAYTLITFVIFWPVLGHMANITVIGADYGQPGGDRYQNLWNLWWANYSILSLHVSPYFTNFLFYPIGANLVTHTLSPLAGIFSIPFQFVSLTFAYNVILLLGFILSCFFSYLLIRHLIANDYGAFLGGLVFGFSPMHLSQTFIGHLNWTSIEFIPLFLLLFMLMIEKKKFKFAVASSTVFLLVVFFGDPEEGIITAIFAFFILLHYVARPQFRREIINRRFILLFASLIALVLALGSPFFIPILSGMQSGALAQASVGSSASDYVKWSATASTIFLPSFWNLTFLNLVHQGFVSNESVAYLGYLPLGLLIYGVVKDWKNKFLFTLFWLSSFFIFLYLSLGPSPRISGTNSAATFGIYQLYRDLPILNIVREPGRFDVMVSLALAVLVGFGVKEFLNSSIIKKHFTKPAVTKILVAFLAICILVEYAGVPFTPSYATTLFTPVELPTIYYQVGQQPGNFSVLVLPTTGNYAARAMFYQTAFKKPIIDGYISRESQTEIGIANRVPLVIASDNLLLGKGLTYNSTGEYTNTTTFWLSAYGVKYVSIINGAYTASDLKILQQNCTNLFGPPIYEDKSTTLYSA